MGNSLVGLGQVKSYSSVLRNPAISIFAQDPWLPWTRRVK
ncbi:hypothetical protein LDG_5419 [Legionella drancourtii LLAP12]|uniref:Uncharacterized protein n=1 Tax=Legionella drancourtii LLAP12 TaxID=658187 RepID=G9EJQ3_9GAMM|nr:hypothetical protein LDG_5419 [Legionella drancourtii LLAP12]